MLGNTKFSGIRPTCLKISAILDDILTSILHIKTKIVNQGKVVWLHKGRHLHMWLIIKVKDAANIL